MSSTHTQNNPLNRVIIRNSSNQMKDGTTRNSPNQVKDEPAVAKGIDGVSQSSKQHNSKSKKTQSDPQWKSLRLDGDVRDRYWILYKSRLVAVSQESWVIANLPVIEYNGKKIKFREITRKFARRCAASAFVFKSQGLFDDICAAGKGVNNIFSLLQELGRSSALFSKLTSAVQGAEFLAGLSVDFFVDVLGALLDITNTFQNFDVCHVLRSCLSFYRVLNNIKKEFQPQGMESFVLSALTFILPPRIYELLRRMTTFSTARILDDTSMFHSFLGCIIEFITSCVELAPLPNRFKVEMLKFVNQLPFGPQHKLMEQMKQKLVEWRRNPGMLVSVSERLAIKTLEEEAKACDALQEWSRRSVVIKSLLEDFSQLVKSTLAYENASKKEPSCFIFSGKPGTMKSMIVSSILQALDETKYVHVVKAATDGKDFWDCYNSEKNVVMDDMGQMGISQWRLLINLVSTVKFPLDCAQANLKDTKFFSSDRIFVTTNEFEHLNGLAKNDCISDVRALWRRGYLFDFNVKRRDASLRGQFEFKYFDVDKNQFVSDFPEFFKKRFKLEPFFKVEEDTPRVEYLKWFIQIIKSFDLLKSEQFNESELTQSELSQLKEVKAEGALKDLWSQCKLSGLDFWVWITKKLVKEQLSTVLKQLVKSVSELVSLCFEFGVKAVSSRLTQTLLLDLFWGLIKSFIGYLIYTLCIKKIMKWKAQGNTDSFQKGSSSFVSTPVSTLISKVQSQVYPVAVIKEDGGEYLVHGIVSGHCIILPSHAVAKPKGRLILYRDKINNHKLLDQISYIEVLRVVSEDLSVVQLDMAMMTPFKNLSHLFFEESLLAQDVWLVNIAGKVPLESMRVNYHSNSPVIYTATLEGLKGFSYNISPSMCEFYTMQQEGLCGSAIVDGVRGVLGMHVAGMQGVMGVAIRWSCATRKQIKEILLEDKRNFILPSVSDRVLKDFSGIKLDYPTFQHVPSKSTIVPSPLYGIFPVSRVPSDLSKYGYHTVKDVGKKSFKEVAAVNELELSFAQKVLNRIIPTYKERTNFEVIKGSEYVAGINKDSSNGFACLKTKKDYIDFDKGTCLPHFESQLIQFELDLLNGEVDIAKMVNAETVKDECRNIEKEREPRSFRVSTLHTQFLTKKFTMDMVEKLIKDKWMNQIMVGVNPYNDWSNIYSELKSCECVWAGDVGKWDGSMLPQAQTAIIEVMLDKYKGKNKEVLKTLLMSIPFGIVAMQDDTYMTNHSMPSGNFLTAIFNSLVNKFYTAMWFFRNSEDPTVDGFFSQVVDFVYGDDKLNGVRANSDRLNALTMLEFFESIGMNFTRADKSKVINKSEDLSEVSFLKRTFVYHTKLGRVMCPLDTRTLFSTLSWVDSRKDQTLVMQDKLHAFQRELFLHEELDLQEHLTQICKERGVLFKPLSEDYLLDLFVHSEVNFKNFYGSFTAF